MRSEQLSGMIDEFVREVCQIWDGEEKQVFERNQVVAKLKEAQFWLGEIEDGP